MSNIEEIILAKELLEECLTLNDNTLETFLGQSKVEELFNHLNCVCFGNEDKRSLNYYECKEFIEAASSFETSLISLIEIESNLEQFDMYNQNDFDKYASLRDSEWKNITNDFFNLSFMKIKKNNKIKP